MSLRAAFLALCAVLAGCAAGPEYRKPVLEMPAAWKVDSPWRTARPEDTTAKGPWWQAYGDPELDALEARAMANNATLAIANARLTQARATLAATSASLMPQIGTTNRLSRQQISANRPLTNYNSPNYSTIQNELALAMTVNYEVDLAGRVAQSISGAQASLEQSAADLENVRLVLSADLATNYFNLREIDIETDVLRRAIALQQRSLELMSARHELGAATGLDLAQQQALLDSTLVQIDILARQRSQFEHAIATLAGTPAAQFTLPVSERIVAAPPVPLGVPSDILERRPDIASAERAMAAANAQIGVASAAYYPSIMLGAGFGYDSRALPLLFDAPSLIWAFGVTLAQTLFDGGRTRANIDFASAGYQATVANYRRVALVAMQEVEDGISGLASLEHATQQARTAVATWQRVFDMTTARYEGGASTYLEVIIAQQALLNAERQATQLSGQQLVTSVFLVKALGGGWQGESLASTQKAALVE